ncbi:hypothetical protein BDV10DRAFT_72629 [Aspergillus recurvatus]
MQRALGVLLLLKVRDNNVSLQKWAPGVSADLVTADETQLHRLYGHSLSEQSILLVLHRERRPAYQKSVRLQHVCPRIEWLSLPCGPYRLARTVQACLQAQLQPLAVEKSPSPSIPGVNYAKTLIGGYASHKEQRSLPLRPAAPPLPASVTQSPKPALNSVLSPVAVLLQRRIHKHRRTEVSQPNLRLLILRLKKLAASSS